MGPIQSPLDAGAPMAPPSAPPIIPHLTQLSPDRMRAVLRDSMYAEEEDDEVLDPSAMMGRLGELAMKAADYPGLLDVMISMLTSIKVATEGPVVAMQQQRGLPAPLDVAGPPPMPTSPTAPLSALL